MDHHMFDLTGKTALVTGAAGGIGSAISHALAKQGARLALSGTNPAKLRAFREELNTAYGHDHIEITCDLSNTEQVEQLIPATLDSLGKIDILVDDRRRADLERSPDLCCRHEFLHGQHHTLVAVLAPARMALPPAGMLVEVGLACGAARPVCGPDVEVLLTRPHHAPHHTGQFGHPLLLKDPHDVAEHPCAR